MRAIGDGAPISVQEGSQVKQPRLVRDGYLDGFDAEFPPGGSVVIGEHGSGKSTLLATLAFGLDVTVPEAHRAERERLLEANLANGRVYWIFEPPADGIRCFSRALMRSKGKDAPHDPPRFEPDFSRPGQVEPGLAVDREHGQEMLRPGV